MMRESIPLFSPSQVPVQEAVLHSLWSPPASKSRQIQSSPVQATPTPRRKSLHTTASEDVFFSPLNQTSPISVVSTHSFVSIPNVEMLSFDYVSTCQSPADLKQILGSLERQEYPSLYNLAQKKLESLQEEKESDQNDKGVTEEEQGKEQPAAASTTPRPKSTVLSTKPALRQQHLPTKTVRWSSPATEDDSLVFSLSPSTAPSPNKTRQSLGSLQSSVVPLQGEDLLPESTRPTPFKQNENDELETLLVQQVESLTRRIHELQEQLQRAQDKHAEALLVNEQARSESRHQQENDRIISLQQELHNQQLSYQESVIALHDLETHYLDLLTQLQMALGRDASVVHTLTLTEQCTLVQDVTRKLASSKAAVKALAQAMALNEQDRHELKQKYQQAQTVITELKTLVEQFRREQDVLTKDKQALERQVKSHQDELQEQKVEATEHQEQIQDYQQALQRLRQQLRSTENCIPTKVYQHDVAEHRQQAEQQQRIIKALKTEIASLQQQLQGAQSANRLRFKHYVKGIIETTEKSAPMTWQRSTNAYRQPPPSPQPLPLVKPPPTIKTNAPVSRLQQRVDVTSSVTPSPPSVASPKTPKATLLINTSSSPPSSSSPTMTSTTKRALSRLSTLKAHGVGRAGLKERLKQIRKSPLATSSVIFFN